MYVLLVTALLLGEAALAVLVLYLLVLTAAAQLAPRVTPAAHVTPLPLFLVVVPAHNEEQLLPNLFASLAQVQYPPDRYRVHVIADNCTDQTAALARRAGAVVHERRDAAQPGKGYALQWLLDELRRHGEPYDAAIILDADSAVSPNFLSVMAARLARGERAVQAYYAVNRPQQSYAVGLRSSALAALHFLRPQGRMVLGASAGLKGNGMLLAADLLQRHAWTAAVTEDIEFHMALLLEGVRVTFAPDALVRAEMPASLAQSQSQHQRWERGRLLMAQRYVPQLLRAALSALTAGRPHRAFVLLDAVMEHVIPPFALLVGASALLWAASLLLWAVRGLGWVGGPAAAGVLAAASVLLGAGLLAGQAVYLLAALQLVHAPRAAYWQLLYAPLYIAWKLNQYVWTVFSPRSPGWVRTPRNEAPYPGRRA